MRGENLERTRIFEREEVVVPLAEVDVNLEIIDLAGSILDSNEIGMHAERSSVIVICFAMSSRNSF